MSYYLIDVGNEQSFLVGNLYIHNTCIEINVHEVYRDTLTHFINTLWVKPSLNGQALKHKHKPTQ